MQLYVVVQVVAVLQTCQLQSLQLLVIQRALAQALVATVATHYCYDLLHLHSRYCLNLLVLTLLSSTTGTNCYTTVQANTKH
jgi:hypothetical protein